MFTIAEIKEAHSKVTTGSDFPNYIKDLIDLGVKRYDIFVNDGREEYFGADDYSVATSSNYDTIVIDSVINKERFIEFLVLHQDGQTNYMTFCNHAAQCGIAKWSVNLNDMICTYFDSFDVAVVIEKIQIT